MYSEIPTPVSLTISLNFTFTVTRFERISSSWWLLTRWRLECFLTDIQSGWAFYWLFMLISLSGMLDKDLSSFFSSSIMWFFDLILLLDLLMCYRSHISSRIDTEPPGLVNLIALFTKLTNTWRYLRESPKTSLKKI